MVRPPVFNNGNRRGDLPYRQWWPATFAYERPANDNGEQIGRPFYSSSDDGGIRATANDIERVWLPLSSPDCLDLMTNWWCGAMCGSIGSGGGVVVMSSDGVMSTWRGVPPFSIRRRGSDNIARTLITAVVIPFWWLATLWLSFN